MTDQALRAKVGDKTPEEIAQMAVEMGLEVTARELAEAEKELRRSGTQSAVELSPEEIDKVAGGMFWCGEDAPDGYEMGCLVTFHHYDYSEENDVWCSSNHFCRSGYYGKPKDSSIDQWH